MHLAASATMSKDNRSCDPWPAKDTAEYGMGVNNGLLMTDSTGATTSCEAPLLGRVQNETETFLPWVNSDLHLNAAHRPAAQRQRRRQQLTAGCADQRRACIQPGHPGPAQPHIDALRPGGALGGSRHCVLQQEQRINSAADMAGWSGLRQMQSFKQTAPVIMWSCLQRQLQLKQQLAACDS